MACNVIWLENEFRRLDFPNKEAAYNEYNKIQSPRCIIHANRVLESFGGKKCIGYAIEKGLVSFLSKDYRVVYMEDQKFREFKDIIDEREALKKYEMIHHDYPKCLVKGRDILRKSGHNLEEYLVLAQLIYVNEEPRKIGFQIIQQEKAKLVQLQGMCKICAVRKANIIHEKCSHLCYCKQCLKTKKDSLCAICEVESRVLEVNL